MKTGLIIVDMINDYLHPKGLLFCKKCRDIIPVVSNTLDFARKNDIRIFFVNTTLENKDDLLAKRWGLHAVKNSFGAEVIKELIPQKNEIIIPKKTYNGFFNTTLNYELTKHGIKNIAIAGIHTHVCVLFTATEGFELGYNVTVLEDCITTDNESMHKKRLPFFDTHIGKLSSSDKWKKEIISFNQLM